MRLEIRAAENLHAANFGVTVHARDYFDAWLKSFFAVMTTQTQTWLNRHINGLELVSTNPQITALVPQLRATTNSLAITQTGFYV